MVKILVVEDKEDQLELYEKILTRGFPGYEITTAGSLSEAKEKLEKLIFVTLVIADYDLADGTGYDLLSYIREHFDDVPVIFVTAFARDEEKEVRAALSFQKGAFDFMEKPIDTDEFKERIKRAIEISEALA